ncbi:ParB/RepB/Spo0J family partition protein [Nocardia sp. NPDC059239]|uniref:ParB/RepB/Spo0J family partition protein n=1 Tax=Nocardia sp. NPDC059239 TaxID=3346785 RepID=UPI0036B52070
MTREERRAQAGKIQGNGADAEVIALPVHTEGGAVAMPLEDLAFNPQNPRQGDWDVSDLASIAEKQLQAGRGVTRGAYLRLWPENADRIGDAKAITVIGNRRNKACEVYGRTTFDIVIDDSMASSKAEFLKWTMLENIARESLNILEEARGIEEMVAELKTAAAVAKELGKTEAFVSQRRKVLKLDPLLQQAMVAGELVYYQARDLAKLPPEEQVRRWLAAVDAAGDELADGAMKPKPKPERSPVTVPQIKKTLTRWGATPDVLAPALAEHLDRTQLRNLMGQLMEITTKLDNENES